MKKYYFDISIWLDLFEKRDERLPKGKFAKELIEKIIKEDSIIFFSDVVIYELLKLGYPYHEVKKKFSLLKGVLNYVRATKTQIGKAKDLSFKRKIPKRDALHALIAKDNKAIIVTRDKHFIKLKDITSPKKPEELI